MTVAQATPTRMQQVVDWSAAIWAGLIAGTVFLALNIIFIPEFVGGNGWVIIRLMASVVMGESVVAPPATFELDIVVVGLLTHYALSVGFALLLAIITHRWGFITGVIVGALFGLALYAINFYTFSYFFPWFFILRNNVFIVSHIIFGAVAGGIYEGFEVEEFVAVEGE